MSNHLTNDDLERLQQAHGAAVRSTIRRILSDSDEAQDAYAETMATAWQKAGELRDIAVMRPWLLRVAKNKALDRLRKRRLLSAEPAPEATLDVDQSGRLDLWAAIARLSPARASVITLHHLLGISVEDSARQLGVSPNTVKTNLRLGLKDLRLGLGREAANQLGGESIMDNGTAARTVEANWDFIEQMVGRLLTRNHLEAKRPEVLAIARSTALAVAAIHARRGQDYRFRTVATYPVMNAVKVFMEERYGAQLMSSRGDDWSTALGLRAAHEQTGKA